MAIELKSSSLRGRSAPSAAPVSTGLALIGSYPPRACGIATFTRDLRRALVSSWGAPVSVVALDRGTPADPIGYPGEVVHRIRPDRMDGRDLRDALAVAGIGVISLQHEFGLFGGNAGDEVLDIVRAARSRPVVTTLHTVPIDPDAEQERVLRQLARTSARLVVMSRRGQRLLCDRYGVDPSGVRVIPHGVPDVPFVPTTTAKSALGVPEDMIILSYGLISPNKGLELAIRALAAALPSVPNARLVIAGATHPEVVRQHGEGYRRSLQQLAEDLRVVHRLTFIDRYLTDEEVRAWLLAADVFVTPYADSAQVTSGTLAYAVASGRAVVSTPYEHALELLASGRGRIVPFGDHRAMGAAFAELLTDELARARTRRAAWDQGRGMVWPAVGAAYAEPLRRGARGALGNWAVSLVAVPPIAEHPGRRASRTHIERMTGPLGLYQHANGLSPALEHGYCTDDNARMLMVDVRHDHRWPGADLCAALDRDMTFLEEAFSARTGRFRNLRAADGEWLDDAGTPDSHGRAMQALGWTMSRCD